jgi:hypothetical protein
MLFHSIIADIEQRYETVKRAMGFVWWSLRKVNESIYIILDGVDLDLKMKGTIIGKLLI